MTEGAEQTRFQDLPRDASHQEPGRIDRQQIRDELQQRRETFHVLLDSLTVEDLHRRSDGTRWSNEELMFHLLFGYIVVVALTRMVKLFGLLPRAATKPFASLLNALTGPFDVVNYWGSRFAAKFYNHRRMGPKFDRVVASLTKKLDSASEPDLRRGMYYPTRWDPFFKPYMTLADIFRYPTQHFDFHLRQIARSAIR